LLVPYHLLSDFSHWRHRAAEFRALAATVEGDEAKEALLRTALHYDKLAKSAEERPEPPRTIAASKPSVPPPSTTNRPQIVSLKQIPFAPISAVARLPAETPGHIFSGISGRSDLK
jgi:hypothetical protein